MSDETPQKELTREELYEKVWSTPGTKLAEELGISDVAITKRCKKLMSPVPPAGTGRSWLQERNPGSSRSLPHRMRSFSSRRSNLSAMSFPCLNPRNPFMSLPPR